MPGKVTLVGAGPGDPGLLTRKGLEALERADVVVYDRLVSPAILALMPEGAVKINVGKEASRHPVPQEQINRILLEQAQQGHNVVRLKGGDPFLFGRGGEELELLAEHRIPFEVTRDPGFAGAGMTDGLAKRCGIDKEAPARTGVPTGLWRHPGDPPGLLLLPAHRHRPPAGGEGAGHRLRGPGAHRGHPGLPHGRVRPAHHLRRAAGRGHGSGHPRRRGGAGHHPCPAAGERHPGGAAPGGGSGRCPEPRRHCGGGRVRPGRPVRLVRPPPPQGKARGGHPAPGAGRHPVGPPAGAGDAAAAAGADLCARPRGPEHQPPRASILCAEAVCRVFRSAGHDDIRLR